MLSLISNHIITNSNVNKTEVNQLHAKLLRCLYIFLAWDIFGFSLFVAGELMHPDGHDSNVSAAFKLFGVGTFGWHLIGMSVLQNLLKQFFKEVVSLKYKCAPLTSGIDSDFSYPAKSYQQKLMSEAESGTLSCYSEGFNGG